MLAALLLTSLVAAASAPAAGAAVSISVKPRTVDPGKSVRLRLQGTGGRRCRVTVVTDGNGSKSVRTVRRSLRFTVKRSAGRGTRTVKARCGSRSATAGFAVGRVPAGERPPSALPIDPASTLAVSAGDNVGGAGFSTLMPFAAGTRVRVTQGQQGGYSHSRASTRYAIDLAVPYGTPVLAGFSGAVAAARGGCAPARYSACNNGWGNFVMLRHVDGTCAIHAHLASIGVGVGQRIRRYDGIGAVGSSGYSTGAHLHYGRMDCGATTSQPWSFDDVGSPREGATVTSGNGPDPLDVPTPAPSAAPSGAATPAPAGTTATPAPSPAPARIALTVDNRVTNGGGMREDSGPVRLTTKPWTFCGRRGCNINGTERGSGGTYDAAVCTTFGERTTNGNDADPSDDGNPSRFESTRYYGVRLPDGTFGLVSEVWIQAAQRGGLGLPAC